MSEKYDVTTILFSDRRETLFGWRVTDKSAQFNTGSILNPNIKQNRRTAALKATVNMAAQSLQRLLTGKVSVCVADDQSIAYIEYYEKASNNMIRAIVDFQGGGFNVKLDTPIQEDDLKRQRLLTFALMDILTNQTLRKYDEFLASLPEGATFMGDLMNAYQEAKRIYANNPNAVKGSAEAECVPWFCDAVYYGLAKQQAGSGVLQNITADVLSEAQFGAQVTRLEKYGLIHVAGPQPQKTTADTAEEPADVASVPVGLDPNVLPLRKDGSVDIAALRSEPISDFFERCKKGQFLIPYQWPEKLKDYIVPLSMLERYFPTAQFVKALTNIYAQCMDMLKRIKGKDLTDRYTCQNIIGADSLNFCFAGDPGTGKSVMVKAIMACLGYPFGLINCTSDMDTEKVEGEHKWIKGEVRTIPTQVCRMHSNGGAILFEEYNIPRPGVLTGALNDPLEAGILMMDGYVESQRHPLTIYIVTQNVGTEGTNEPNESTANRFSEGYIVKPLTKEEFVDALSYEGYRKKDCKDVYNIYTKLLNFFQNDPKMQLLISRRNCQRALRLMKLGNSFKEAVECTFLQAIARTSKETADAIEKVLPGWI